MAVIIPVTPALNACSLSVSEYESNEALPNFVSSNTFFIRKKEYNVQLNAKKLVWERTKSKNDRKSVSIENILTVKLQVPKTSSMSMETTGPNIESEFSPNIEQFTILFAKRVDSSSNLNKWRIVSKTFQNKDSQVCASCVQFLQRRINEQAMWRPKRLLLFVNPYGGKKRAFRIYDKIVKPIFQLAGIDATTIISQRSNQIRDFVMTQSLEHYDGIVCVGGDGTFSELFNGFIFRAFKDLDYDDMSNLDEMPKINEKPLGIIPAGSTDTIAFCLNGTCDVHTIALNIALGQVNGMDLSSVSNQNGLLKFYASIMSYGFLGDVAVESEKLRWMGPRRYDYSGFKKLLLNRGYDGEVSLLVDPFANDPLNGPLCLEKCPICETEIQTNQTAVIRNTTDTDKKCNDNNKQVLTNHEIRFQPSINIDMHVTSTKSNTNANTTDGQYFKTINGKFFMINCANISCACPRSPNGFSKYCHLCDGYVDLILVRHTSLLQNLRFLLAMSSRNCKITDLHHVEIYRTKKFSFKPTGMQTGASTSNLSSSRIPISDSNDTNHSSVWNCDGEVVQDSDITIRSHRRLINVYRRGIFNAKKEDADNISAATCCLG